MASNRKMFPIMDGPDVPWSMMEPARGQANRNHSQSLERLAERGGLSCYEAVCALESVRTGRHLQEARPYSFFRARLAELVEADQTARIAEADRRITELERENAQLQGLLERRTEALEKYANEANWSSSEYQTDEGLSHRLLDRLTVTGVLHGPEVAQRALRGGDDE